jgi:probable F420-dependent oxidoreductase
MWPEGTTFTRSVMLEIVLPDESVSMPASALVDIARTAEELGFVAAWLPDHVLPPEDFGSTFGGVYEPLVTIGHLSAVTESLQFGTSVLVAPLRNPFVVAKQVTTLQALSNGRIILGVGTGWNEDEFHALGAEYHHRGAVTDDMLSLWHHLFRGGTAPYRASRYSYERGVFAPVPKDPVPIMIGGNSDAALKRAARHGDIWQGIPTGPDDFAEKARRLAELAGPRDVTAALRFHWDEGATAGSVAETVHAYSEVGAQRIAIHFGEHDGTRERMVALTKALNGA